MSESCSKTCTECGDDCEERTSEKTDFIEKTHELSDVKKVIAVVSGKGGVGKSLVTSLLAVLMNRNEYKTAILDADITGPSIPKAFGIKRNVFGSDIGWFPAKTKTGIAVMSLNLLVENETDPVIWRGPILGNTVKQFWTDVIWNNIDIMFLDMPPGTGDVPLTVFQSIPVDGIIVVTSPQELVSMIVEKAVNMAKIMNIPILGIVENLSYVKCPDCDKEIRVFGESHIEEIAEKFGITTIAKIPMETKIATACDRGMIELFEGNWLDDMAKMIEKFKEKKMEKKLKVAVACEGENVTEHFGHCENFNLFEVENNQIIAKSSVPNPGHKPGFLPNYLNDIGVNVIISGGMGGGAVEIFNEKSIEVITGAQGNAEDLVKRYLNGELQSTGSVCHEHQHNDKCGE